MSKVHRFYVGDEVKLKKDFWLHDQAMLWQWNKVLRFKEGQQVVLFDGFQTDRLYKIDRLKDNEAHLKMVTELERVLLEKSIYLFWSLLKKDNNEHILQKCTELGISNFVPIISKRTIKKDFNLLRARKIIKEASEQCGRSSIPHVREPVHLEKAIDEYKHKLELYVCQHGSEKPKFSGDKIGVLVGPEGGWTQEELNYFDNLNFKHIGLSDFVLRGETAAIIAVSKVL